MGSDLIPTLAQMRLVVGYLGEKAQLGWWQSSFLTPAAQAFTAPVFPRTHLLARYHGVLEAARRVHDNRIGVGSAYHLFRLPEALEEQLHEYMRTDSVAVTLEVAISSRAEADAALRRLAGDNPCPESAGPVRIGSINEMSSPAAWGKVMGCYQVAVAQDTAAFPYFAD